MKGKNKLVNQTKTKKRVTMTYKPKNLKVLFDNGGGITIDCPKFCHHYYGNYNYEAQAAGDFWALANGADVDNWDGHEPFARGNFRRESVECNIYSKDNLIFDVNKMTEEEIGDISGCAESNFCKELKKLINLQHAK